jgi:hypothetical protein
MIYIHEYLIQAGSLAKQGLHEIEAVFTKAQHLGLKLPVSTVQ